MKIAYLDCFSGVSGDMLLGAFVSCGLEVSRLEQEIRKLDLGDIRLQQEQAKRGALMGTRILINAPPQQPSRKYRDIVERIQAAPLAPRVQQQALTIFRRLGEVEAALHGWTLDQVHFHEVGAVDSIADIVGSCAAVELLGIEQLHCSPLNLGSGTVKCQHGLLPVPAPAALELLKGIPAYSSGVASELVTPTGAAVVASLAASFGPFPAMRVENVGYGAGSRDLRETPNVLRLTIGEAAPAEAGQEQLFMLEANLDDMNPQVFNFFAERALAAGALDVFFTPVQMKKNRPGVLLSVLCSPAQREKLMEMFFQETTTLGVRGYEVFRRALERESVPVQTPYGKVRVKVARRNGQVLHFSPEFEDCRRLATENEIPLKKVLQEATIAFGKERESETSARASATEEENRDA